MLSFPALHSRQLRRWISAAVLMALLFMQIATAVHACPQMGGHGVPAEPAAMEEDCHGMPAPQHDDPSALCKAHCVKDGQSAAVASPDLQANPAALTLLMGLVEPAVPAALALAGTGEPAWQDRRSGAPPLYLSLLVLRN